MIIYSAKDVTIINIQPKQDLSATGRLGDGIKEIIFKRGKSYHFISTFSSNHLTGICEAKEIFTMKRSELTEASDIESDWNVMYIKTLDQCDDLDQVSKKRLEKIAREMNLYQIEGEYE